MIFITSVPVETTCAWLVVVSSLAPPMPAGLSGKTAGHLSCHLSNAANNTTKQDCSPASGQWPCPSSPAGRVSVDVTVRPFPRRRVAASFSCTPRKGCSATPVQEGGSEKI